MSENTTERDKVDDGVLADADLRNLESGSLVQRGGCRAHSDLRHTLEGIGLSGVGGGVRTEASSALANEDGCRSGHHRNLGHVPEEEGVDL